MFDRDHYALVLHTQRSFASATSAPTEKTMVFGIVTRYNNNKNKQPPLLCTSLLTALCVSPSPAALTCSSTLPATAPLAAQLQAQLLVAVQVQVQALSKMEQSDTSTLCAVFVLVSNASIGDDGDEPARRRGLSVLENESCADVANHFCRTFCLGTSPTSPRSNADVCMHAVPVCVTRDEVPLHDVSHC